MTKPTYGTLMTKPTYGTLMEALAIFNDPRYFPEEYPGLYTREEKETQVIRKILRKRGVVR
jgi:hypothetical protein